MQNFKTLDMTSELRLGQYEPLRLIFGRHPRLSRSKLGSRQLTEARKQLALARNPILSG
jgi:hypothetical protein